jgi:hypothetical protein
MIFQASGRSSLMIAAALVAAIALGFAGTDVSYAAANGAAQLSTQAPADVTSAAPAAADANAAPTEQQTESAAPSPFAGNTVADNTDATATATDATANAVAASADDSSGWDKASIIGKIFIACGTLLTLGSAARMFMI